MRRNVRGPTCGAGETLSPVPTPRGDTPTVHYCTGDPGIEPAVAGPSLPAPPGNRRQHHPLARLSTGYRHALPPPQGGGGGGRRPGRVGVAGEELSGTILPGEGVSPSPVPSPRGDSHHGPVYRDKPGKPGSGSLLPRETAASTTPAEGTEGSAPWGMGRRPDRACSSGIDAVVPFGAGSRETLSGGTTSQHLHRDCAGGYPSGSVIAWRK